MYLTNESSIVGKCDTSGQIERSRELMSWLDEIRLAYSSRESHKVATLHSAETLARFESLLGSADEAPKDPARDLLRDGEDSYLENTDESGRRWLKNLRAQSYLEGMRLALADTAKGASVAFAWNALAMVVFVEEQLSSLDLDHRLPIKGPAQAGESPIPDAQVNPGS